MVSACRKRTEDTAAAGDVLELCNGWRLAEVVATGSEHPAAAILVFERGGETRIRYAATPVDVVGCADAGPGASR